MLIVDCYYFSLFVLSLINECFCRKIRIQDISIRSVELFLFYLMQKKCRLFQFIVSTLQTKVVAGVNLSMIVYLYVVQNISHLIFDLNKHISVLFKKFKIDENTCKNPCSESLVCRTLVLFCKSRSKICNFLTCLQLQNFKNCN